MLTKILIVADAYPPLQTSAAIQIRDLALEFNMQGIVPLVITPDSTLIQPYLIECIDGIKILRLKTTIFKDVNKYRRAFSEILLPFFMIYNFRRCRLNDFQWDSIVWYSPTIFLGPFIYYLKKRSPCFSYLILRDIFPAWALDLGIIKKGLVYYLFRFFEKFQYSVADMIGVQAFANLNYFSNHNYKNIEVLQNWLTPNPVLRCSIDVSRIFNQHQKIFVYAGNMGIAQEMSALLNLADELLFRKDIGILFVGWGSEMAALERQARERGLSNIVFHNTIPSDEIPGLYSQCHIGLIALDPRHKTHNIPGKFLSYLQSGLPVLAIVNEGNDLHSIIDRYKVGRVTSDNSPKNLRNLAESIVDEIQSSKNNIGERCKKVSDEFFTTRRAAVQIIHSLNALS